MTAQLTRDGTLTLAKSAGLKVIPCSAGTKIPSAPHGFKSSDEEIVAAFGANKDFNIALVSGAASGGVVGIDCETEQVAWSLFPDKEKLLGSTWCIRTPHGGIVVLVKALDTIPQRKIRLAGEEYPFDLCGEGGYFLIHGTVDHRLCDPTKARCPHRGTSSYHTVSETFTIMELAGVEASLFRRCEQLGWKTNGKKWPPLKGIAQGVPEGSRNQAAFVMSRYLLFTLSMPETDASFALKTWNSRNVPPLYEDELEAVLRSARGYPREKRRVQG